MSSVDERIVEMKFNNGQFQKGITETTRSLSDLETALNIDQSAKTLDTISNKLGVMGVIGATGLNRLANSAIDAGAKMYDATVGQLIKGGERRSQNFAQARFQLEGLGITGENLTKVMDHANYAVKGTAYGFDEAAVAASSFVASQVPIDDLGFSLRAISGVAAMTGRSFGDVSQIFTTVAGNGRLMASELNRIGASGLNAAAALAKYLNVSETEVRDMVSKGQVDFQTFAKAMDDAFGAQATKANDLYTGSLANVRAALSRIGEPLADGKFERLRLIFNATTPIIDRFKESINPLLQKIKELRIESGERAAAALEKVAKAPAWKQLDESFKLITSIIGNFNKIVRKVLGAIGDVFGRAFGKASKEVDKNGKVVQKTGGIFTSFFKVINGGLTFIDRLLSGIEKSNGVFGVFRTVLSALAEPISLVWTVIRGLGKILWEVIGVVAEFVLLIADAVNPFKEAGSASLDASQAIHMFFQILRDGVDKYVSRAVEWIRAFRDSLIELRNGGSSGMAWLDNLYNNISKFRDLASMKLPEMLKTIRKSIVDFVKNIDIKQLISDVFGKTKDFSIDATAKVKVVGGETFSFLGEVIQWIRDILKGFVQDVGKMTSSVKGFFTDLSNSVNYNQVFAAFTSGAIVLGIWKVYGALKGLVKTKGLIDGLLESASAAITNVGSSISGYFNQLTKNLKSNVIIKIAVAIAMLAGSIWVLSTIDPGRLWGSVAAILVLATSLALLGKIMAKSLTPKEITALRVLAGYIISLAIALGILSVSVWVLSKINIPNLIASVGALVVILGVLTLITKQMSKYGGGLIKSSAGIFLMAIAILALSGAIWVLAKIPYGALWKGIGVIAILLGIFTGFAKLLSKVSGPLLSAAGSILILSIALFALAGAIFVYSMIPWSTLVDGALKFGMVLGVMILAVQALSRTQGAVLKGSFAILTMAFAIGVLAGAFIVLNLVDMDGLFAKALVMVLVVGALALITKILSGNAAGMIAASFAIIMLAGAFLILAVGLFIIQGVDVWTIIAAMTGLVLVIFALAGAAYIIQFALAGVFALTGLIIAFSVGVFIIAAAMLVAALAAGIFALTLPLLGEALILFGEQSAQIVEQATNLLIVAGILAVLGFAALIAGIGVGVLGLGLIVFAAALLLVALVAPLAGAAILALGQYMQQTVAYIGPMAAVSGILLLVAVAVGVLGIALIAASLGVILFGVGVMVLVVGLMMLGSVSSSIVGQVMNLVMAIAMLAAAAPLMIAAGAGILAFGVGALVAAIGIGLLGAALTLLGIGLVLVSGSAASAGTGLVKLAGDLEQVAGKAFQIGAASLALAAFGAAALVAGAGSVLLGVGMILLGTGLMMVEQFANRAGDSLDKVSNAINKSTSMVGPARDLGTAFNSFGTSLQKAGDAGQRLGMALTIIGSGLTIAATASQASSTNLQKMGTAMVMVSTQVQAFGPAMSAAFGQVANSVSQSMTKISAAIKQLIQSISSTMMAGVPMIQSAVNKIVMSIIQGFTRAAAMVAPTGMLIVAALVRTLSSGVPRFMPIGLNMANSFVMGLRSGIPMASSVSAQMANIVVTRLRMASMLTRGPGIQAGRNFVNGLRASLGQVSSVGSQYGSRLVSAVRGAGYGLASVGYSMGAQVASGMANGLWGNMYQVTSAAYALAASIPSIVKRLLGIRSPSRVATKLMEYFGEGAAIGLNNKAGEVSRAAGKMATSAVDQFREALDSAQDIVSKAEFDPTIRPTMDLTDIYAKTGELNSLFGSRVVGSPAAQLAASIRASERSNEGFSGSEYNSSSTTFIQNNYSPRALSRAEIYRQTKNLISEKVS